MARFALVLLVLAALSATALGQVKYSQYKYMVQTYNQSYPQSGYQTYGNPKTYSEPTSYSAKKAYVFSLIAKGNDTLTFDDTLGTPGTTTPGDRTILQWDLVDLKYGKKVGYITGFSTVLFGTQVLIEYTAVLKGGTIQIEGLADMLLTENAQALIGGTGAFTYTSGWVGSETLTLTSSNTAIKLTFYLFNYYPKY